MGELGFAVRTSANMTVLTVDVVKTSAIEGETLNTAEVRSSIARRLGLDTAGLPIPRRAVEGIVEVMLDATQNYAAPLSPERLFSWHTALFPSGRTGMRPITVGAWRNADAGPMQVVSGSYGRERVHFEAPEAPRLEIEMTRFIQWFNQPMAIDPVIRAALAHFWFVTIHPFDDGNGRIARAIADMALARGDGAPERYYSMSSQLEAERKHYYAELESAQRGDLDITRWLMWFTGCLDRALDSAETLLGAVLSKARVWQKINERPVNDRQRHVINRLLDGFEGLLTTSKYAKLAKCSQDSALRDIADLVDRGILVQNDGRGRSTSYSLAP